MPPGHEFMSELKDFKFYFNTSDREMGVKMAIDDYENEEAALLKKFLKPGMGCIDAGAQTGFYTLHMAKIIGLSGKLYAFEPNPKTFNLLQKNIIVNDFSNIVNSYNVGLSDIEAEIEASEVSNMYISGTIKGGISRKMKLVRGDDIIKDRIDFIKIDIEGCEPSALRGMTRLINQYQPIIFSEVNEYWLRDRAKMNSQQYLEFLQSLGYRVYNIKSVINGKYDELSHLSLNILDTIDVICMPRK
jgi:FkbM family methyltransferase